MQRRDPGTIILIGVIALAVIVYGTHNLGKRGIDINPHDPSGGRIDAFDLQPGEIGVAVRVRHGQKPAAAVNVWATHEAGDDDNAYPRLRKGQTDDAGLVRVPVQKGGRDHTRLFARDAAGRVGGGTLSVDQLLSAPNIVLVEVAPRSGRLVTVGGQPIADASLTAEAFSTGRAATEGEAGFIDIPDALRPQYGVSTDADGRFSVPGVPVGYDCRLEFKTAGYGQGTIFLPAASSGECRLAAAGSIRIRVSGDSAAAVDRLRCRLFSENSLSDSEARIDGSRSRRHDGSETFFMANMVPGDYRVQIQGTPRNRVLPAAAVRTKIAAGQTAEVTIALKRAGRVTGRAVDGASGQGLGGVRLNLYTALSGDDSGYGGHITTDSDGHFSGYVPAGVPVTVSPDKCPAGYALPGGPLAGLWDAKPVTAAAGAETALPDIKLYADGSIAGMVVADGQPVAGAAVEVRWDGRKSGTLKTDASGRFHVARAPAGQHAAIRVRAGDMVNATVTFLPEELVGPLTIPVSSGNTFRFRGKVADVRGRPVEGAKVVVVATIRPSAKVMEKAAKERKFLASFQPADVEAVFTDGGGRFETGPLWPECVYTLTVSADGLISRRLHEVEGKPGKVHELKTVLLRGTSGTVTGTVVSTQGMPLAGVTVINSGDAPKRLTADTNAAGRFTLSGLYDGPAVVVAHKAGYRWAFAVVRPGEPEPKVILRSLSEPPAALPPLTEAHRQAEADLVRRLTKIEDEGRAGLPKPPPAADSWAEARKDLEAYLRKQAKEPGMSATHNLRALAGVLAKEDKAKALRVLRDAAAAARRLTMPAGQPAIAFLGRDLAGSMRVLELIYVATAALDLGGRDEAAQWLAEAETMAAKLPEVQRRQPLGELAVAWVALDPARTEKLLAAAGSDVYSFDHAIGGIIRRLLKDDPQKAIPWLDRFKSPRAYLAGEYQAQVAVRLAGQDLAQAVRLADGIGDSSSRALALARLAVSAYKRDPKLAHSLVDKAAAAVAAEPHEKERDPGQRLGAAIYLLWQAKTVAYADLVALVAIAMTSRAPVPAHEQLAQVWWTHTMQLAAGAASVDPAAGRALLGSDAEPGDRDEAEGSQLALIALALADPAAALRRLDAAPSHPSDWYTAAGIRAVLQRRSTVLGQLGIRLGWLPEESE